MDSVTRLQYITLQRDQLTHHHSDHKNWSMKSDPALHKLARIPVQNLPLPDKTLFF